MKERMRLLVQGLLLLFVVNIGGNYGEMEWSTAWKWARISETAINKIVFIAHK